MIRFLEERDLPAVWSILCFWIEHSSANLSWKSPDFDSFACEQLQIAAKHPYCVAEWEGRVIGFGYAHPFLSKDAYQFDAELTIYFEKGPHHHLVEPLYFRLEELCRAMGFVRLISCTTSGNEASLRFQIEHGFREYGRLPKAGYKNGIWHDVSWLEKQIGSWKNPVRCSLWEARQKEKRAQG